jgi:hypothetical protein
MKHLLLVLFLFPACYAHAQVNYQPITLSEALARSNKEGKLIMVQYESVDCYQCNEVADKGLNDPEVSSRINQTFIPIKISSTHPDRALISSLFNINAFGTLFINQGSTLVHAYLQSTTFSGEYKKQIDLALNKSGETLKVSELEKEYKKGNRSPGFLEALLLKKRSLNLPTEALLDEYATSIPTDSLRSERVLQFIAEMAPMVNSLADKALRQDRMLFSQAWYKLSLQSRSNINSRIIYKSMQQAIKDKNEPFAKQTASFAQSIYTNPVSGGKAFDRNMLHFYDETGDTTKYFRKAIAYYERYFLSVSPDSIRKTDSLNALRMMQSSPKDTVRNGNMMTVRTSVAMSPIAQKFTWELNEGAWGFYKKTNNPYLLSIATEWSAKALEFIKTPEAMDTYARLLYKQGKKEEASKVLVEAITLKKERGFPTNDLEKLMDKIKAGSKLD